MTLRTDVSRRRLLQVGGLGLLGLNLPSWLRARATERTDAGRESIRSCILIFLYGGPSHLDTFDMKPGAPAEVRGPFQPIATGAAGIQVCEHLPHMAGVMHHVALVRGMHHPMRNHNSAAVEALCGRTPLGGDQELLADDAQAFPCYGASLSYLLRDRQLNLASVALPHVMHNVVKLPGQVAGFLFLTALNLSQRVLRNACIPTRPLVGWVSSCAGRSRTTIQPVSCAGRSDVAAMSNRRTGTAGRHEPGQARAPGIADAIDRPSVDAGRSCASDDFDAGLLRPSLAAIAVAAGAACV